MKIRPVIVGLAFVGLHTSSAFAFASATDNCPTRGQGSVERLASDWILVGWEKKAGDPALDFRQKFARYYEWSKAGDRIFYDDFDPNKRVVRDPDAYGAIWAPTFTSLRSARHALSIAPSAIYGHGLAVSTLEFVALIEDGGGKMTPIRTLSTLTWRCGRDGWRIIREHNSSTVVPEQSIASYFMQPSK